MTLLLAFHGFKESGKNTAANVVGQWGRARGLNVHSRGFADKLKLSAVRALGLDIENMNDAIVLADSIKQEGEVSVVIPGQSMLWTISGREYLQKYGTESHRDVFGFDFWADQILPLDIDWRMKWAENEGDFPDIAVITDLRFENEAKRVHELGGEIIEIYRPDLERNDSHLSEVRLPARYIDYTIQNDKGLDEFELEVNSWMTANYHMRFVDGPVYLDG